MPKNKELKYRVICPLCRKVIKLEEYDTRRKTTTTQRL